MSLPIDTTAIVTGAGSGIGAAVASALAGAGARVVLAGRTEEKLRRTAAAFDEHVETLIVPTDVGDEAQVQRLVDRTMERFGRIDLLVNNAGYGIFKPIIDLTADEFDGVVRVNLRGPFLCMKYTLPVMYRQERGTVVTISSLAGRHGFAGGGGYCAGKFGVVGLTECAFHEARSHNVRIVTVCPGSVDTDFFDEAHTTAPNRERVLQAADVAAAVMLAVELPERALLRELDIRPTNPGAR